MNSTTHSKWKKVSQRHPCPICGKPDWCLWAGAAGNPDAAICQRIESEKTVGTKGAGWLHPLRNDDAPRDRTVRRRIQFAEAPDAATVFNALAERYTASMGYRQLELIADLLGVSTQTMEALRVGWSSQHQAFAFPMRSAHHDVLGIRLRFANGRKLSVKGGREGLFIPNGTGPECPFAGGGQLLICEGPTDCAALHELDFNTVGRPSCTGGVQLLVDLVCDWHPDEVTIVADADAPGQRGARYLASRLTGYVASGVRIVTPPAGAKDAREWVKLGANRDDILQAIEAAPLLKLTYGVKAVAL